MNKPNKKSDFEHIEEKYTKKDAKEKKKMKISGGNVKKLQRIIKEGR